MKMTKAIRTKNKAEALDTLRALLNPGDRVYTILEHVARSGMSRRVRVIYFKADDTHYPVRNLTFHAAMVLDLPLRDVDGQWEIVMQGCGYDAGYQIVHDLSYKLFGSSDKLSHSWL